MALADADEECKAAILSLSTEPAPALHDILQRHRRDQERGTRDPCCRPPSPDNVLLPDKLEEGPDDGAEPLAEPTIGLKELTDQIQAVMQRLDERGQAATKMLLEKAKNYLQ
ncbi:hypothetical protein DUI87_27216 [Hirundo rustica rustica]|uniref:Uncharacterized protein n=1 Tax=Hirundo rustica rustica TaxID=333673 RepID=A0A3M0J5M8_HIRRU|nr:hypothetical protein DUI87_27216 [Hirundo rustica rustica]